MSKFYDNYIDTLRKKERTGREEVFYRITIAQSSHVSESFTNLHHKNEVNRARNAGYKHPGSKKMRVLMQHNSPCQIDSFII